MDIRNEIKKIVKRIGRIRDRALMEKRDLTASEAHTLDDMLDEISGLEELGKSRIDMPVVGLRGAFPNFNDDNFNKRSQTKMKNSDGVYKSFGNFLADIRSAGSLGGQTNPKLFKVAETRAAQGLSESVPSDGGFLVQQDFADTLLRSAMDTGLLAKRCRQMPISVGNSLKIPGIDETSRATGSRWGGIQVFWSDEATEATASKPKLRQLELHLHKLIGLCYVTDELIEDAAALAQYIQMGFSEEFGFMLDESIVNGTGAGTPLGIMNAGCLVSVGKESGQTNYTIVFENIGKMWSRLIASARADSVWLINQDCEPQLSLMTLGGTTAPPVYFPAGGAVDAPYATLYGRPVIPIEQCQTVGTTGDIILASFGKGYIFSQKGGIKSDFSISVRFQYDEGCYRFVLRISGQPMLRSAITPFKGSNTLSHFVKLDERKP